MPYGTFGHVGISFQQSFGTVFTDSYDYIPILNESIAEDIPPLVSQAIKGRFEEGTVYEGYHSIAGDIVAEVDPWGLGYLLYGWCGQSSMSAQTSTYQHDFLPAQTDWGNKAAVPPATIEVYRAVGSSFVYYDSCFNTLTLEYAHGELMKITTGIVGKEFKRTGNTTAAFPVESYFPWNLTSVSIGGAAVDEIAQLSLSFNQSLEGKGTLDGTKRANRIVRTGFRMCDISGTLLFDDHTQFDKFVNQTRSRMIVTVVGATVGDSSILFTVDIPQMRYTSFPVNISGGTIIEVGFSGKAEFDETSNYLAKFTLQNTKASYP